jgi:hypothetical protein
LVTDAATVKEALLEQMHMQTMTALKMERLQGKTAEFIKWAQTLETTFMMDTIYVNFGIRPNQFHQALTKYPHIVEEQEVKDFQVQLASQN